MSGRLDARLTCRFCKRAYSRQLVSASFAIGSARQDILSSHRDVLKRHTIRCPSRGDEPIPEDPVARRGRLRHSCTRCSRKKLFCDGRSPCGSCNGRGRENACSRTINDERRLHSDKPSRPAATSDTGISQTITHYPSSVAFLLSENYEQVFSKFNFPEPTSPDEPANRRTTSWRDTYSGSTNTPFRGLDEDFVNSVLDFDFFPLVSRGPSTRCASVEPQGTVAVEDVASFLCTDADVERLIRHVMTAPTVLLLQSHDHLEVQQQLQTLCRPASVVRFVSYYFNIWHHNCRIVHRPSFGLDTYHEPLALAVIFLGAMYSPDPMERVAASAILEHVESFIFSRLSLSSPRDSEDQAIPGAVIDDEESFQSVQAAFLTVITLFWTGAEVQKRRAATNVFSVVVENARSLGLMSSRQSLEDRRTGALWLAKECRIRTANYILLTDCAFLFFKGVPLRVWDPEIECDLPCLEVVFDMAHPFTHPSFSFNRHLTVQQAFSALFTTRQQGSRCPVTLTMLDSFVLIHMLYRFVNSVLAIQMTGLQFTDEVQHPYNTVTSDIRTALNRWFEEWTKLHEAAVSKNEWEALGFYKNGDQYAYATLLLLSSKARPHLRRLLRPNSDRLSLLQELNK